MKRVRPLTTAVVLAATLVGTGIWWVFFRGPSSAECAPVRELLSFNKTEIDKLNAKTHVPEAGSYEAATDPGELDYRAWVDGLTDRAAKVTAPELAGQASDMAGTAARLVRARLDFDAQSKRTAPGAAMPAVAMVVTAFNDEFEAQVRQLAKTCPE
ncbi:hypothetical protein [Mycolicibacterium hodleri]|uniref:Uncharacterized protein n=1 Tax=Mycolicibacterium hodleri TaxID=49897 RepID=A0A502DZA5_9MYCO|nr:hypothetical protein [Mycolicibacterium hodleri]TPG29490.1 hypothetical protein EAH80_27005 [Mycolicibacterium hodleri]